VLADEESDQRSLEALHGNCHDGLRQGKQGRLAQADVVHEGTNGREASVASAHTVPPFALEVLQEGEDHGCTQVLK
jgi:hypothetical protein